MLKRLFAVVVSLTISVGGISGEAWAHGDTKWKRLAHCESTHRWHINTGNGYYGGLQISKSTWDYYRNGQFARYPHKATRANQIRVARRIRDGQGWGAWAYTCRTYARYGYYPN